jgi:hypothetical protein
MVGPVGREAYIIEGAPELFSGPKNYSLPEILGFISI